MIEPVSKADLEGGYVGTSRPSTAAVVAGPWVAYRQRASGRKALYRICKRGIDLIAAFALLVLLSPFGLVVAAVIRLSSPGGAIFRQKRAGRYGKPFWMYKFRSMQPDAEQSESRLAVRQRGEIFFKPQADKRVTSLGRYLRRYSIDEFPQLWNVLRGEMSLVGPRPLLMHEMKNFPDAFRHPRFRCPPGLTGLWQISGRSLCSERERLELDLAYVERASLWLDLKILVRTLPAVISGEGAY